MFSWTINEYLNINSKGVLFLVKRKKKSEETFNEYQWIKDTLKDLF